MSEKMQVLLCSGGSCISSGAKEVKLALEVKLQEYNLDKDVRIIETGCMGPCELGPVMVVYPDGVFYKKVSKSDVDEIVREHLFKGRVVEKLLYKADLAKKIVKEKKEEIPFFARQQKIVLSNCGNIDPESIEEYIASGGYEALGKVLTSMKREEVIEEIKNSGLRGRGGAGFPTGLKWSFSAKVDSDIKYVVCNADEGDPGAFMDRAVLEGDPHTVLEGMAIGAYAIGASKGYIYIRAEYPLAIERLKKAIEDARKYNFLGKNIFETDFSFDIEIRIGAGAFVCGEETALLASIEGKRGMPRPRPPYPAVSGLWGKPTVINNVETWANVRHIILKGANWFSSIGTEKSKGTKIFALSGNVVNTGLVEVPMGTTLGELIFDIGGGIPNGKKFKAVQIGGPAGGCIPAEYLDTPIDYESLKKLGAIMGSGGVIVLDEDTCMVNLAKYFIEFTSFESCGKCAPCRIGLKQMLKILDKITQGEGTMQDLEKLEKLALDIKETALCGLGQAAPNPVLSTLKYFKDEYIEHIKEKKCRASVCAALFTAPCQNRCPANVDVPRYVAHLSEGEFEKAFWIHTEHNPFPSVCARVCPAFCEDKCQRGQLDEVIQIREVKRSFADYSIGKNLQFKVYPHTKKEKVAIIGAGPAGLSAAFYLAQMGYRPDVYERLPVAGGFMAVGIPEYRLPKFYLNAEIERIKKAGVNIYLNTEIKSIDELKTKGYKAIFVGIGAHKDRNLNIKGENLEGVLSGIEFLKDVSLGKEVKIGESVVVIGGGSTAMDAARVSKRLGAKKVSVVYRRSKHEMPAYKEEIEGAIEEGVIFNLMASPIEILGDNKVESVKFAKTKFEGFSKDGRRRVVLTDKEFTLKADTVIVCIGQKKEQNSITKAIEKINKDLSTNLEGVFVGGDFTSVATVVKAVGEGRKAAISIDRYLGYSGKLPYKEREIVETTYDEESYQKQLPANKPKFLEVEKRKGFEEVNLGLTIKDTIEECKRCLHCDRMQPVKEKVKLTIDLDNPRNLIPVK